MQTTEKTKIIKNTEEFFFAGGQVYKPQTIMASSREEAEKIFEETKEPVESLSNTNQEKVWQKESEESSK